MDMQSFASLISARCTLAESISRRAGGNTTSDRMEQGVFRELSTDRHDYKLFSGMIQESSALYGLYRVNIHGEGLHVCRAMSTTGGITTRNTGQYDIGTTVFVAFNALSQDGIIVGCLPQLSIVSELDIHNAVSWSSQLYSDSCKLGGALLGVEATDHMLPATWLSAMDDYNFGEHTITTISGVKFHVDPDMACLAADDATGMWVFADDSMLRIAGVNMQCLTSGSYTEQLNDNGECTGYTGSNMFSWESLGYYKKPSSQVIKEYDDFATNSSEVHAYLDLDEDLRKPFHRLQTYTGYLGQGFQQYIVAPPKDKTDCKYETKESKYYALSRISQLVDGTVGVESSKSISLIKRCRIPAIQQQELADDVSSEKGDSKDSDYDWTHEDVKVTGTPESNPGPGNALMQSAAAINDYVGYVFNYEVLHPFLYHVKDYYVEEESDLGTVEKWNLDKLKNSQFLDAAPTDDITIDSRYGSQKYYQAESGIHLLPDGGIVIYDGYGAELRMTGGSITLSCPGDIWLRSGKNTFLWAGHDLSVRAKGSMDCTTSEGSVRVKAEKNLELIGGNGQTAQSGVIIESKGKEFFDFNEGGDKIKTGGILLKSKDGPVAAFGKAVAIKSTAQDVVLDASNGEANIITMCKSNYNYATTSFDVGFTGSLQAMPGVDVTKSLEIRPGYVTVPGSLHVDGYGIFQKAVVAGDSFMSTSHIYTANKMEHVGDLNGQSLQSVLATLGESKQLITKTVPELQKQEINQAVYAGFYTDNRICNTDVVEQSGFSFRLDDECKVSGMDIYADRWQSIVINSGLSTAKWSEKGVSTYSGEGKYPFPGDKYFDNGQYFVTQPLSIFDTSSWTNKARWSGDSPASGYENPKYETPEKQSLNSYPVIMEKD